MLNRFGTKIFFFVAVSAVTMISFANPFDKFFLKQKYPVSHLTSVVDVVNAELEFRSSGVNAFLTENTQPKFILPKRLELSAADMPCGSNCIALSLVDSSINKDLLVKLLESPCDCDVLKASASPMFMPSGASNPFAITKTFLPCHGNTVTWLSENKLKLVVGPN